MNFGQTTPCLTKIVCPNKNIGKVYFSKLIGNLENITESTEKDYTKYVINIIIKNVQLFWGSIRLSRKTQKIYNDLTRPQIMGSIG